MSTVQTLPARPDALKPGKNGQPEKLAPHSAEAEEGVLGSILINPDCLPDLAAILQASDFFIVRNGWIFEALLAVHQRGHAIDNLTVIDELRSQGRLDDIGGSAYITYLINNTPTHIHGETYAAIVQKAAIRRRLLSAASEIAQTALEENAELPDVLAHAESTLSAVTKTWTDPERFPLTKTRDVLTRPKPTWLYPSEIPEGALVTITGASGNGKTFISIDYAMRIAQQHKVLYVAAERPYAALMRGCAWLDHYHATDEAINDDNIGWIEQPTDITDPSALQAIIAQAKQFGARCIIFDTFSRCAEGIEENSPSEMKRVMGAFDRIKTETGATVVVVHHTGWAGGRERGGSSIRDYAEVAILVEMTDKIIKISCNKMSSADEFQPRYMTVIPVGEQPDDESFGPACVIPETQIRQTADSKLPKDQIRVLETLGQEIYAQVGMKRKDVIAEAGIPVGSIGRVLSTLKRLGFLTQGEKGEPYIITKAGREKLSEVSRCYHDTSDTSAQPINDDVSLVSHPYRGDTSDTSIESANRESEAPEPDITGREIDFYAKAIGVKFDRHITDPDLVRVYREIAKTIPAKLSAFEKFLADINMYDRLLDELARQEKEVSAGHLSAFLDAKAGHSDHGNGARASRRRGYRRLDELR